MRLKDIEIGKEYKLLTMALLWSMIATCVTLISVTAAAFDMVQGNEVNVGGVIMGVAFGVLSIVLFRTHWTSSRRKCTVLRLNAPKPSDPNTIYAQVRFVDGTEKEMNFGTTVSILDQLRNTFTFGTVTR
jgi:hypothetical protein